jgi:PKHD-type hydroxylase
MIILPHKNAYGNDWCAYWENFLTSEQIDRLLNHSEWKDQQPALVGASGVQSEVDPTIRRTKVSWLQFEQDVDLYETFAEAFAEVNSRFFHCNVSNFSEAAQLTTYTEHDKDYYDWHTDMSPIDRQMPRKLTMVLGLSDPHEYEGGLLQIKTSRDNETLETKKGRAWFFPSYVLHRVTPVTKGTRKSLVLWAGGEQWK